MTRVHLATLAALFISIGSVSADDAVTAVEAQMRLWAQSYGQLTSGAEMLQHYHKDAVFWGTGARVPFDTPDVIAAYFERQFSSFSDRTVGFETAVVRADEMVATATGLYTLSVTAQSGEKIEVRHRYSFTFIKDDEDWKIFHQHSSQVP